MALEIARLTIDPADAASFEATAARAEALFLAAEGCGGVRMLRSYENPVSTGCSSSGAMSPLTRRFAHPPGSPLGAASPAAISASRRRSNTA